RVCSTATATVPSLPSAPSPPPFADSLQRVAATATPLPAGRRRPRATLLPAMRVTITCEECGERHRLERRITDPGPISIICHACELPLQAVLDGSNAAAASAPVPEPVRTPSAWSGVVDFRSAA